MNCCLWIILLLACRGNGGFGCGNNGGNNQCGNNWCGSGRMDDCGCTHHDHDDCGCMNHMYDDCGCAHNDDNDCGCNDNHMGYETYGCQENGIPCPPPVPGNYMR